MDTTTLVLARSVRDEYERVRKLVELPQDYWRTIGMANVLLSPNSIFNTNRREIEQAQRMADEFDAIARARLAVSGWPALGFLLFRFERHEALHIHTLKGKRGLSTYIRQLFRRPRYARLNRVVVRWWTVPYLKSQRAVLSRAIRAHKRKDYVLSMPPILSAIEGLAWEINKALPPKTDTLSQTKRPRKAIYAREVAERFYRFAGGGALFAVDTIYKHYWFAGKPPSSINRHAIVHGKGGRYYTEENSLKLILLLESFANVARGLIKHGLMD